MAVDVAKAFRFGFRVGIETLGFKGLSVLGLRVLGL